MITLEDARAVLEHYWGYDSFRPAQEQVIQSYLDGFDTLAILPTGYGKSSCFQIPAVLCEGTAIVVSPLIALMKDQADDCNRKGISATYVNSHVTDREMQERFDKLVAGDYKLFYIAPERIGNKQFQESVRKTQVSLLVVDEAHSASLWGHEFRPAYSRIKDILPLIAHDDDTRCPIMAVTATATQDIESDIAESLGMDAGYKRIIGDPIRPNLDYRVLQGNAWTNLRRSVSSFDPMNGRYIVYAGTRRGAEMVEGIIAEQLRDKEVTAVYHAGMTKDERTRVQDQFKSGMRPVIVATCAFGMGIDVPNIRGVVHLGIPGSVEAYCQECGRAGRDGKPSHVTLIADEYSVKLQQKFLDDANPPYYVYPMVWNFLHDQLEPKQVLSLSGSDIATVLQSESGNPTITGSMVLGVLSMLESHGLVNRIAKAAGTDLIVDRVRLEHSVSQSTSVAVTRIGKAILGYQTTHVSLNKDMIAKRAGVGIDTVSRVLRKLEQEKALHIETAFRGKSTSIRRYGADLDTVLSRTAIEQRRDREQRRLDRMVQYTHTSNRIQFIRDYFLKGL